MHAIVNQPFQKLSGAGTDAFLLEYPCWLPLRALSRCLFRYNLSFLAFSRWPLNYCSYLSIRSYSFFIDSWFLLRSYFLLMRASCLRWRSVFFCSSTLIFLRLSSMVFLSSLTLLSLWVIFSLRMVLSYAILRASASASALILLAASRVLYSP